MNSILIHSIIALLILLPAFGKSQSGGISDSNLVKLNQLNREINQLKEEVRQLKTEIQQLRHLLPKQPPSPTVTRPHAKSRGATRKGIAETGYWCTKSSNKRHNPSCRYYKIPNGRPCSSNEGTACKLCGG